MRAPINKIRRIIDVLQNIVDEADYRKASEIKTSCNTYGMRSEFIGLGSYGYLDLNADVDDLIEDHEFDDDNK